MMIDFELVYPFLSFIPESRNRNFLQIVRIFLLKNIWNSFVSNAFDTILILIVINYSFEFYVGIPIKFNTRRSKIVDRVET